MFHAHLDTSRIRTVLHIYIYGRAELKITLEKRVFNDFFHVLFVKIVKGVFNDFYSFFFVKGSLMASPFQPINEVCSS